MSYSLMSLKGPHRGLYPGSIIGLTKESLDDSSYRASRNLGEPKE